VTSNWNEFSAGAQETIVIAGGWHNLMKSKEFSERIFHLISRKIPIVLLEMVEYFGSDEGIRNLADVVQISRLEDGRIILTNGDILVLTPNCKQKKSITKYPFNGVDVKTLFSMHL